MNISPTASYYIRRLLRQYVDHLKWIVHPRAGIQPDSVGNIDAVIRSLYLDESEIHSIIVNLEKLVAYHQALVAQSVVYEDEVAKTEEKMFWLLGFKFKE